MAGPKSSYGRPPAKGTKQRQMLLMCLRSQGMTAWEAQQAGFTTKGSSLGANLGHLSVLRGYDVRPFRTTERLPPERTGPPVPGKRLGRHPVIYRLVGKYRWNGTYRSFVNPRG